MSQIYLQGEHGHNVHDTWGRRHDRLMRDSDLRARRSGSRQPVRCRVGLDRLCMCVNVRGLVEHSRYSDGNTLATLRNGDRPVPMHHHARIRQLVLRHVAWA